MSPPRHHAWLRCHLQLLPLSPLPASLAFLVTTAGSDWTQFLVKLCNVEARRAAGRTTAGRNSKATQGTRDSLCSR